MRFKRKSRKNFVIIIIKPNASRSWLARRKIVFCQPTVLILDPLHFYKQMIAKFDDLVAATVVGDHINRMKMIFY